MRNRCALVYNETMSTKEQKLLPAYLAVGEDALKRRAVLEKLRKRIAELGDLEFNHDEFDAERASGSAIAVACNTLPFASELRLVEVAHAEKLGKQDVDIMCAYLSAPSESTVLVMSADKLAKNSRLYKAVASIGKTAIIDCAPMKRYELVRALRSMAVGHGATLTEAAAEKLVSLVGEDTIKLDSELRKLALAHTGTDPITESEVDSLVSRTTESKPWELVDAFSARDIGKTLKILPTLGSSSPYALIGMCTTRLRELSCAKSLDSRGEGHRLAEVLGVPTWRVKNHLAWSRLFSDVELKRAFSTARACEQAMKSGTDPDTAFKDWLVSTMAR